MASLRKDARGRSPFWICCYTGAGGRRVQKSTKLKERKAAQAFCDTLEETEQKAARGELVKARLQTLVSDTLEKVTGERLQSYTVRGWLEQWVAGKHGAISKSSEAKYRQVVRDFLAHLGAKADLTLEAITPKHIIDFRAVLLKSGRAPQTVEATIKKILATPFIAAMRLGVIRLNPVAAVPHLRFEKNERDIFTADEVARLIAAAAGDWKGVIRLGYYTGARLGDIVHLCWKNVDLSTNTISFVQSKTRKKITLAMHSALSDWLLAQPSQDNGEEPLFPSLATRTVSGRSGISAQFAKLMQKAGIGYEVRRKAKGAGRTIKSRSFHSLRHSFNSALANAGVPVEVRQQFTGHSSAEMNAHYTHLEMKTMRAAVEKIPTV